VPGFLRFDAGVYAQTTETLEGAAQYREYLQQGLLGLGGCQQRHLARLTADLSLQGHR